MRGVCIDPLSIFKYGLPSPTVLKNLGTTGNRLVYFDDVRFYWYYYTLHKAGLGHAIVLTSDSFASGSIDQMEADVSRYVRLLDKDVLWIIGNEWNIDGDASYPVGNDAFIEFWNSIADTIRRTNPNANIYIGGMMSEVGILDRLESVYPKLSPVPAGVDFHLYLNSNDEIREICTRARNEYNLQVSMGEWNDSDPAGIQEDQRVLDEVTDHSFFFCYNDGTLNMGLVSNSGKKKPIHIQYSKALKGV